MQVGKMRELLKEFKDETEIKISGWMENPRTGRGFSYEEITLGSQHIIAEDSLNTGKTTIKIGFDMQ
jgi:hypothetical protein